MRSCPWWRPAVGVFLVWVFFTGSPAEGVAPEDGPAYLTDSHGAAGVVMAMFSLADKDPKYLECAEKALEWLSHVKRTDARGRAAWYLSESAPSGHRNRRVLLPGQTLTIINYFDVYEKTKRPEHRDVGLAAARWLAEVGAGKRKTELGTAYSWGFTPGNRDVGLVAGHSHGLGKYIDALTRAHQMEPDPAFEEALRGTLVNLKTRVIDRGEGRLAFPAFRWPHAKEKDAIRTGYCYGQAGVAIPLMRLAVAMPELKLSDGTTPLGLGNGVLKYLASEAKPRGGGFIWPYMRHTKTTRNPGLGSGTGGIGWAFLEGYRANRQAGDEQLAQEWLKYARGAADYAIWAVEHAPKNVMTGGGGDGGFGVCGGAGGTAFLPMLLAEEIGDEDPAFERRVRRTTGKLAGLVIRRATPVGETLAWTLSRHERRHHKVADEKVWVNLSLDYGQTGVVLELAEMGKYLDDEEILQAARRAADFIIEQAVKTDHGWKFARFVRVKQ